jgi:hypothetical protein
MGPTERLKKFFLYKLKIKKNCICYTLNFDVIILQRYFRSAKLTTKLSFKQIIFVCQVTVTNLAHFKDSIENC